MLTITKNETYKSIEIAFDSKPDERTRAALKAARFRWHSVKKVWYGYATEEEARAILGGEKAEAPHSVKRSEQKPTENKFGVKVGDIFSASWGYEQTNVNFFQVIALVGSSSVRVREVYPPMINENGYGMCADRVYKTGGLDILPPARRSVFIKNQENGDLKRLKSYAADGKSNPQFFLASYADAHYCAGETQKVYESWYY